ncbi:MAG TPA: hypothetical protein VKT81_16990 [Bryobacteraceae bacterium]|nr:hypothetical protein [Bryobacteraceae bacterium]
MAKQALIILITVLAFGILVPWYKGYTFLDPRMLAAYGLLAVLFVAPASAESFASDIGVTSTRTTLGRLGLLVAFGWGVTVLVLITAIVTLNLAYWHGSVVSPPAKLFAGVLVCSLMASAAVGTLSALMARTLSAGLVKTILRFSFLIILLAFAMSSRLPDAWQIWLDEHTTRRAVTNLAWEGAAVCGLLTAALLVPLLKKSATSR